MLAGLLSASLIVLYEELCMVLRLLQTLELVPFCTEVVLAAPWHQCFRLASLTSPHTPALSRFYPT